MREDWAAYKFKDVATAIKGKLPKSKNEDGIGIPYLTASYLRSSKPDYWIENLEGAVTAEDGDCLILWDGAGAGDLFSAHRGVVSSTMAVVTTQNSEILREFLTLLISSKAEYIKETCRGTTVPHVSPDAIANMDLHIPPLPEQKRIVDLITSVDSYIEALQQQLESAKRSRNAVLYKTFHIDGSNWKLQKLDECTKKISDGSHNPPKGIEESNFLMLSSKDVWDGYLTNLDPRYLKQSDFELENRRTQLECGDVLLTIVGTIGRCAVYRGYPKNVTFQRSVCVIKTTKNILNESFLMMYLQSIQSYLDQNARGVAQRGIYLNQIRDLEVPTPTINEQLAVVSNIEVFDTFIQETQKVIAQTQNLRISILSDLLSGDHEIPSTYDKVMGAA